MYYNDWLQQRLAQERRYELLQQAERERLARLVDATPNRLPRWTDQLRDWLGQQLVVTGQRLQSDHKAEITTTVLHATRRSR